MSVLEPPLSALSAPLEFLRAAHGLVREQCDALEALAADPSAAQPAVARTLVQFFGALVKLHLADEEEEIFKRLQRVSLKMADAVATLTRDHQALRDQWQALEPLLARPAADPAALQAGVSVFVALKRAHLVREEQLFSQAQHLLSSAQLKDVRAGMLARRGRRA